MNQAVLAHRKIKVGVFVDLHWLPNAGGHVKCWERFSEAATLYRDRLDMTVHFLGDHDHTVGFSDNVRFRISRPRMGTDRFGFLQQGAGHTDMAPANPDIIDFLPEYDVLHTTDIFAFANTVRRFARRQHRPMCASVHTDLPYFTEVYSREIMERAPEFVSRFLVNTLRLPNHFGRLMRRRVDVHLSSCSHIFVSKREDIEYLGLAMPEKKVTFLRRGVDLDLFHPSRRDRRWLQETYGIGPDTQLVVFAGRIDASKNVMVLAEAVQLLHDKGVDLHVFFAGEGGSRKEIQDKLGPICTAPGNLHQSTLAKLYASGDLFAFPSESEVSPNVVLEAKASGLPVVVSNRNGGGQFVRQHGVDGIVVGYPTVDSWAGAIGHLLMDENRRQAIAAAGREHITEVWPSWSKVLGEDLLPYWQKMANVVLANS